jgi:hypothetical protein
MVRSGGERKGAAVPQRWITEGAAMTRVTMIIFEVMEEKSRLQPSDRPSNK